MEIFPTLNLIGQPEAKAALDALDPAAKHDLLVLYYGELSRREFLARILKAAGYDEPGNQLHLLEWPRDDDMDLAAVVRKLGVRQVMLFGYEGKNLGLHFTVANYFPVEVAGTTYLLSDSVEFIEEAKEKGDNRPAGALWTAVKNNFLRET